MKSNSKEKGRKNKVGFKRDESLQEIHETEWEWRKNKYSRLLGNFDVHDALIPSLHFCVKQEELY
eukprot:761314-Hanusia_phi.AAC.2